jgi:hypothetical protein
MSDPITIATTLITLGTFIKDLIDLGQNIKRSIEKVCIPDWYSWTLTE